MLDPESLAHDVVKKHGLSISFPPIEDPAFVVMAKSLVLSRNFNKALVGACMYSWLLASCEERKTPQPVIDLATALSASLKQLKRKDYSLELLHTALYLRSNLFWLCAVSEDRPTELLRISSALLTSCEATASFDAFEAELILLAGRPHLLFADSSTTVIPYE